MDVYGINFGHKLAFFLDYAHKLRFGTALAILQSNATWVRKKYQLWQQVAANFAHRRQKIIASRVENMRTESQKTLENRLHHVSSLKNP